MGIEFLQQHAPELLGEWITPEPDAGLAPPENLYDAQGNPLNYIQDQGGPRQFLAPAGQAAYAPTPSPLSGRSSPTPTPLQGPGPMPPRQSNRVQIPMMLRGEPGGPSPATGGLDIPSYALPDAGPQPQNLLPSPGRAMGTSPVVPIPPAPTNRLRVPSEAQERVGLQSNLQRSTEDIVARQAMANRTMSATLNPNGSNTPTPQSQGPVSRNNIRHPMDMRFQDVINNPGSTLRDLIAASGREFDFAGFRNPTQPETPTSDLRGRTGNTQRVSSWSDSPAFNLSTPEGLADFNSRMGLTLGDQVRTQAEQDRLFNNRQTPTRHSYHITGEAFDVPPDAIGGLSGTNAVNAVLTRMQEARYNVDDYEVKWETGHGNNQGTGAHVHVEPRRRRR